MLVNEQCTAALAIADKMHAAMKDHGSAGAVDLGTITALVDIAKEIPGPAQPILDGAGNVLSAPDDLLKGDSEPTKPAPEFADDTAEGVIKKTKEALQKLAELIASRESEIDNAIKDALTTVTSHRSRSFDMPKPELVSETQTNEMKVDLGDLDFLATEMLPQVEKEVSQASDSVSEGTCAASAWYQSSDIGISGTEYGPYEAWSQLASLAQDLTAELAWEIEQSGKHLEIAADRVGRTEVEASMRRHARNVSDGSGTRRSTIPASGSSTLFISGVEQPQRPKARLMTSTVDPSHEFCLRPVFVAVCRGPFLTSPLWMFGNQGG